MTAKNAQSEHAIQNAIREHVSRAKLGVLFRANVGEAWTGSEIRHNPDGSITIKDPRRLRTGLPVGFSDLFGVTNTGKAVFIEVKSKRGKPTPEQEHFLINMLERSAYAGVARSIEDAEQIFFGRCKVPL